MKETTTHMQRIYDGRIVSLELHDVELPTGQQTKREVVRHGPAVAIVAEHPSGHFLLVRQFRKPLEREVWECVAGCVNPNEPLEAAARRELREETGYEAAEITRLGAIYPSPGYVDERIEIYYARVQDQPSKQALDEDEWVETHLLTRENILAMIDEEQIEDAKTIAAWWLYELKIRGIGRETAQ